MQQTMEPLVGVDERPAGRLGQRQVARVVERAAERGGEAPDALVGWSGGGHAPREERLVQRLGVGAYKIGSDDLVYTSFLDLVARRGKPMIISTGMADAGDVTRATDVISATGNQQIVLLHCVEAPNWDQQLVPYMEALTEAKRNRQVRAVGVSCHDLRALNRAAEVPWVDVIGKKKDLSRELLALAQILAT